MFLPERKRQFGQPPLDPIRFDARKVLPVHPRCALVRAALGIGMAPGCLPGRSYRTGRRSGNRLPPSLLRATPSAASEHVSELLGCPISRSLAACCVCLELRPLPSTGITRLHRYYGPLRHLTAPGLSLTGVRLTIPDHALRFPVLRAPSLCTCCRHCPGAADGRRLAHSPSRISLPRNTTGSACTSSFSRIARVHLRCGLHTRTVTEFVTAVRGLQTFRRLHACPGCFRLERCIAVAGLAPAGKAPPCHGARGNWSFCPERDIPGLRACEIVDFNSPPSSNRRSPSHNRMGVRPRSQSSHRPNR